MDCLKPQRIENPTWTLGYPESLRYILVPCGQCVFCRMRRTKEWTLRLIHESQYHDIIKFVTLTYDDDHLPENGSLQPKDLTDFWKRLRLRLPYKVIYFACGEYGSQTWRPHYHFIIFDNVDKATIEECWTYGFSTIESANDAAIAYVAGYVQKKIYDRVSKYEKRGLYPPFTRCSHGIGLDWCMDNERLIREKGYIRYNGSINSVPRYYRKKLGITNDIQYFEHYQDELRQELKRLGYDPDSPADLDRYYKADHFDLKQRAVDIEAKKALYRGVNKNEI